MSTLLEALQQALADRYAVESELGHGGMATVFRAEDLKHGRPVAIKVLSPDLSVSIGPERFEREIRIAARLQHPHILPVHDSGEAAGLLYYVMPLVFGESLRSRIDRESQLPIDETLLFATEIADALSYAHEQGVVHRDVKPENVLLSNGHAILADFGIAHAADAGASKLTATGVSLGTALYMSPEQIAGDAVEGRSDVYSLGCVVYEMLVGQPPFTGPNLRAIMARHTMENPPSIHVVRSSVPAAIEDAVMCALQKVPADRFRTMADFRAALTAARMESGTWPVTRRYAALHATGAGAGGGGALGSTGTTPSETFGGAEIAASRRMLRGRRALGVAGGVVLLVGLGAYAAYAAMRRPAASADARRLAVLYFADEGGAALRPLADGLTESLIGALAEVPALDVISANGVRRFRASPDVGTDTVRRALGVGTIIRGTVQGSGKSVKITVRLVDAPSDVDVAHKSFSLDTGQALALQHAALDTVVSFLRARLGEEIRVRSERDETKSAEGWMLVQRAEKRRKDADSLLAAGATDPALLALAGADSLLVTAGAYDRGWSRVPTLRAAVAYQRAVAMQKDPQRAAPVIDSGLVYVADALRAKPNDAAALERKGQLLYLRTALRLDLDPRADDRTLAQAESTLTAAVEVNKDQAGAWVTLSNLYYRKPDLQAANRAARNAYLADAYLAAAPAILNRLFWTSHDLEEFPEALRWCTEGHRRFPSDPSFVECRLYMYTTRYERPNIDSAWAYERQYEQLTPVARRPFASHLGRILVAGALARASLADSARHLLLRARANPDIDPQRELVGREAVVRVILGDQDEAVRLIADYLTVHPDHRKGFASRTGWWWRDLQTNPKFKELIAGAR